MSISHRIERRSLSLRCHYDEVDRLHQFLREATFDLLSEQTDEEFINSLLLAVHEAFTNVVRHAYSDGTNEEVLLQCMPERNGITVELIDHGVEFNPLERPTYFNQDLLDKLQNITSFDELDESQFIGGYGIPIIQAAATSTRYQRSKSGDNHLCLYFENHR